MRLHELVALVLLHLPALALAGGRLDWPSETREHRPWAYHWWLGSAVDKANLAREFARYREGGLGGVHIVPIYGAKGAESRYLDYLSPAWMEMLTFAVKEANGHDLGVDMTTGTGWCFGGPNISPGLGGRLRILKRIPFPRDGRLPPELRPDRVAIQAVVACGPKTNTCNVTDRLGADGTLSWRPPADGWTLYILGHRFTGWMVKRAAPGGEGPMLNPFYGKALETYLERFTKAFATPGIALPRAMYHDSFEYQGDWSPDLPEEFMKRRGYRIEDELPALAGQGDPDRVARVRCDASETLSDMMVENVFPQWIRWCHERRIATRNQAHGSPGNWLDLYALADVPETEMFGHGGPDPKVSQFDQYIDGADRDPLVSKFASSAAHTAGRRLVAAETGTWLAEHFCETFEEMKCEVDLMFLSGVNHVLYHGCVYSPDDAAWPGWLFYASTEMNPRNPLWREAPALNGYVARCQSILQSGVPDNDVLLYWPIHDGWTEGVRAMSVHNMPVMRGPLGRAARTLWARGYGFDYVSDRLLEAMKVHGGTIQGPGSAQWQAIVVPRCRRMPHTTLARLLDQAEQGATVIFERGLPGDVPGLGRLEERRDAFRKQLARLGRPNGASTEDHAPFETRPLGAGRVLVGKLEEALASAGVRRETLVDHPGVRFVRRRDNDGRFYLFVNHGLKPLDAWLPLATPVRSAAIFDPMTGKTGIVGVRRGDGGRAEVYCRLEPGHSILLRTFTSETVTGPAWTWQRPGKTLAEVTGPWTVDFIAGGPTLPKGFTMDQLASWTTFGGAPTESFAGTASYTCRFDATETHLSEDPRPLLLDLGNVKHVARVYLNGRLLGTSIMRPHRLLIPADLLKPEGNQLRVEVTNLAANRIRDLDRRRVPWKIFHNANVLNIEYRPLDASAWPVSESGLIGPVRILTVATRGTAGEGL